MASDSTTPTVGVTPRINQATFTHVLAAGASPASPWPRFAAIMVLALVLLSVHDLAGAQQATNTPSPVAEETDAGAGRVATEEPNAVTVEVGNGDPNALTVGVENEEPNIDASYLTGTAKAWLVGGLLVLAVVTVTMHYLFLSRSRQEYFRAAASLFRRGVYPRPALIPAHGDAPAGPLAMGRQVADDGAVATLEVIGPAAVHQGEPGVFVALLNGARTEQAVWTIDPADAATATPGTGAITNVTATGEGTFSLMAEIPDQDLTTTPKTISILPDAAPVAASSPELPFIGQGFASLVGAVVLIVAVVVLAAIEVDNWDVIGTIFGALAGYLFGTATNNRE